MEYRTKRPTLGQLYTDIQTLTTMQIAEKYGVTYTCVSAWKRRYGIKGGVRQFKEFDVEALRQLAKTNTTKQLAEHYGVTNGCIWRWCHDNGIKPYRRTRKDTYGPRGRLWPVLGTIFTLPDITDAEAARVHDCTREYVGQIRAAAIAHGIL